MKDEKKKKISIGAGLVLGIIVGALVVVNYAGIGTDIIPKSILNDQENYEKEQSWQTVYVWTPTGENTPAAEAGGFMSCFLLDYGQDPETVLANNATDWDAAVGSTVHAYADSDDWSEDTPSEDPFYVVVRARFTEEQAKSGSDWNGSRCRITLTASGDESISYTVVANGSAETYGGGIESDNNSDYNHLYINFYWDDNDDGYLVTDDGSLTISEIKIEAKY